MSWSARTFPHATRISHLESDLLTVFIYLCLSARMHVCVKPYFISCFLVFSNYKTAPRPASKFADPVLVSQGLSLDP